MISAQPNLLTAFTLSSGACSCYKDMKDLESQDTLKTGAKNLRSTLNKRTLFLWAKYTYNVQGKRKKIKVQKTMDWES